MKELVPIFSALADEARLRILHLLLESGELCVCDIESILGFTQTKVSRHLRYLKRSGLIRERRCGRWMLYAVSKPTSAYQQSILAGIQAILRSQKQTRQDAALLRERVDRGCCATFVHVKPNETPTKITLN